MKKNRSEKSKKLFENLESKLINCLKEKSYSEKDLIQKLNLKKSQTTLFQELILTLLSEEKVEKKQDGKLCYLSPHFNGVLSLHPRGFGFVKTTLAKDIFIPRPYTLDAVDGDEVEVELFKGPSPKGPEGMIKRVLKRAHSHVAGTILYRENGFYLLYCPLLGSEKKVFLTSSKKPLKTGDRVLAQVQKWGSEIYVKLFQYIGPISDPSLDIQAAIFEFDIPNEFPKNVENAAKRYGNKVLAKDLKNRSDLTSPQTLTIDPTTAKDFDDALSLTVDKDQNFDLGVHIADVSHYVKKNTLLDKEAYLRANSTYFPGRCVPMLPACLSNGLCSLKPKVIRLTISVLMKFTPDGELIDHKIVRGYIKSAKRFTYEEALEVIERKKKSRFAPQLKLMVKLALLLKKKRMQRGSIDFALPETQVIVDDKGTPLRMEVSEYDITHQLVEEFMLKANETVAQTLSDKGRKLIYRIHEEPAYENFEDFFQLARILGFSLPAKPDQTDIQKLFLDAKNTPYLHRLSISFIRSLKLAFYSPENLGHYGLQLKYYTHFTSPIRRYSDLIVHRVLFKEEKTLDLDEIAKKISEKERLSMRAENSVVQLKKMRFLQKSHDKDPYQIYKATITKVKPYVLFFELTEFSLEGSLHISELKDDYYLFDGTKGCLRGEHTKRTFSFGSPIEVTIVEINLILQETKFALFFKHVPKKGKKRRKK